MKRIVSMLLLLAAPATAQDIAIETVNAYGQSMLGVWRISQPAFVSVQGLFSPVKYGPTRARYCRIELQKRELLMICDDRGGEATVALDGNHVHFAWGTMMARVAIDGELDDADHFRGEYKIKVSGIPFGSPVASDAARIPTNAGITDTGGKAELLRQILTQGLGAIPHQDKPGSPLARPPQQGAVTAITYVGEESRIVNVARMTEEKGHFVYLVSFIEGERLCTLHQSNVGVLDTFRCF